MHNTVRLALPFLLVLSLLSLVWLLSPILSDNFQNQGLQSDPDSVLFIRFFDQSFHRGELIKDDTYGCFPFSMKLRFPPFHMGFLLFLGRFFDAIVPGSVEPLALVGAVPVLFVWLNLLAIIHCLCKISRNAVLVILCSFFLLPGRAASLVSGYMKLDYDFLISFFIWLWLCNCLLFIRAGNRKFLVAGCLSGTLLTFTWAGSPFFFFFVVCQACFCRLMNYQKVDLQLKYASESLIVSSIPVFLYLIFFDAPFSLSLNHFGYFQPLCIIAGGLFLLFLSSFQYFSRPGAATISFSLLAGLVLWVVFREQLSQAGGFLFHIDPVHKFITELAPLLSKDPETPVSAFFILAATFGPISFFFPACFFYREGFFARPEWFVLRNWLTIFLLLSLHQIRFLRWLSVGSGLYSGISAYLVFMFVKKRLAGFKFKNLELALIFLPFFIAHLFFNHTFIKESKNLLTSEQIDAFSWIKKNTPHTAGYDDGRTPEYGILTYRNDSNVLAYYARRPVVVSNAFWGFRTMAEIFSAESEQEAFSLCDKYRVKYIFINTVESYEDDYYNFWHFFRSLPEGPEYRLLNQDIPRAGNFKNWFYFWLRNDMALANLGEFGISSHFRIIYVADTVDKPKPPYVIFEKVKGARLKLQVDPETDATVSLALHLGSVKNLYNVRMTSDSAGKVSFVLPYSTGYNNGRTLSDAAYKVTFMANGVLRTEYLRVDNRQAQEGLQVSAMPALTR